MRSKVFDYELVKDLCQAGVTLADIAHRFDISRQRVHQWLARYPELKKLRDESKRTNYNWKQEEVLLSSRQRQYGWMTKEEFRQDTLRTEQEYRLRQKRANTKGKYPFDIGWADLTWPTVCPVLGIELDYYCDAGRRNDNSVSFDRIDPAKGYTKDNVRVMSWRANRIKNDGTAEEHRKIYEWMLGQEDYWLDGSRTTTVT